VGRKLTVIRRIQSVLVPVYFRELVGATLLRLLTRAPHLATVLRTADTVKGRPHISERDSKILNNS